MKKSRRTARPMLAVAAFKSGDSVEMASSATMRSHGPLLTV